MTRRLLAYLSLAFILAIFAVFLLWPIYQIVRVAFFGVAAEGQPAVFTLGYFKAIFLDADLRRGLLNSAGIAIAVTFLCTLISVPLALLSVRYDFRGKGAVSALLLVPLILPPFVGAIGMRLILGRLGALTAIAQHLHFVAPGTPIDWFGNARVVGVILVEALGLYPILYLNVAAALANLDPAMEQAAANLGASRWTLFRRITLPLMRPGLFAGGTIVLIWSFTELGTPLMFDYFDVTPVQIFHRLTQITGNPLPYALVVVMLLGSALLYAVGKLSLGRTHDVAVSKATTSAAPSPLGGIKSLLALLAFAFVIALALLPHVGVILLSFSGVGAWYESAIPKVFTLGHYATALTHDMTIPSIRNSVAFSAASVAIDLVLGLTIAWLIVRSTLPGRRTIDSLAMLPLAVPGVVLAFGYLALSLQVQSWIGQYDKSHHTDHMWLRNLVDVTENPTALLIIAYAMRRLPYVVRSAVAGLEQAPRDLELAAQNLGASAWLSLRKITVPLIAANLVAGAMLAFAFAMLEVSDSIILAQRQQYWPITKAMYELVYRLGDGPYLACALGAWAMVLLTLTMLSANAFLGRRIGAMFRV